MIVPSKGLELYKNMALTYVSGGNAYERKNEVPAVLLR